MPWVSNIGAGAGFPNRVHPVVDVGALHAKRRQRHCDTSPSPALDGYCDTVNVPVRGEIKIIIPFTDSTTVGKFVYHCHLLSHEDKGMMATIEVTPRLRGDDAD